MKFASQHSDFYKSDHGIIGIFNQKLFQLVSHSKSHFLTVYRRANWYTHGLLKLITRVSQRQQGIFILKKIGRRTVSLKIIFGIVCALLVTIERVRNCNWKIRNQMKPSPTSRIISLINTYQKFIYFHLITWLRTMTVRTRKRRLSGVLTKTILIKFWLKSKNSSQNII